MKMAGVLGGITGNVIMVYFELMTEQLWSLVFPLTCVACTDTPRPAPIPMELESSNGLQSLIED